MQAAAVGPQGRFTPPDAIWIALWDGDATLSDGALRWPLTSGPSSTRAASPDRRRDHADIDSDIVGGPLAR